MLRKKIISALLVCVLLITGFQGLYILKGAAESQFTERLLVTYEDMDLSDDFSADPDGLEASFLSSDSRIKVVGGDESVVGSRSLAINKCDMRWWNIGASDKEMYVGIVVKVNGNYHNKLDLSFTTSQPSELSANASGKIITVTKQDGRTVILDASGNVVTELEAGVRYNIRAMFTWGSNKYSIYVNNVLVSENCEFKSNVYSVEGMNLVVSEIPQKNNSEDDLNDRPSVFSAASDQNVSSDQNAADSEPPDRPLISDPYILADNPSVSTSGHVYPQKYSAQKPGALPSVNIPDVEVRNDDISVYINTTKIAMSHAPVLRDGTLYLDIEQLARCVGMEFKKDNSNKTFHLTNTNAAIDAIIDNTAITINDRMYELTAPPRKINGVVMVTPNFINEAFNAKVWWDEPGKMLVITTGEYKKDDILRNVGGKFYMNGEPYYEISFNKFDLCYQIFAEYRPNSEYPSSVYQSAAAEAALKQLSERGFSSVRVFVYSNAFPYIMYDEEEQETYFKAMDQLFDLCDKYNIKLVVCLGLIEDYLLKSEYIDGEGWIHSDESTAQMVTDADSESRQNVYKYLDLFINRYKDRKSVLMWEIENEGALKADVGEATRNVQYSIMQLAKFYGDCADKIRTIDSEHLITSGDSILRPAQWNLFNDIMNGESLTWNTDTAEERLKALSLLNEKLDVISVHTYGTGISNESVYKNEYGETVNCDFDMYMDEAARLGKVLYNGETNGGFSFESQTFYKDTQEYIDSIIDSGVQLSHWWTFRSDRQGFSDGYLWRIDSGELLDMLSEANQRIKDIYTVNKAADDNTSDVWDDPSYEIFDSKAVIDGIEFVVQTSFRSKMLRLSVICGVLVAVISIGVFMLTREKLIKKRKKDIV